jgi:hypothetical protein
VAVELELETLLQPKYLFFRLALLVDHVNLRTDLAEHPEDERRYAHKTGP